MSESLSESSSERAEGRAPSPESLLRVRFATAPAEAISLVEARVALINAVVAAKKNGRLILRIDDTHPEKCSPEVLEQLYGDLRWLEISWQEGPDQKGEAGPYKISERSTIYQKYLKQLLDDDKAYPCYCAPEKLDEERLRFLAAGKTPRYAGTCRALKPEQKADFEAQGAKPLIRLKVDRQILKFRDGVFGDFVVDSDTIGDWVLATAGGRPSHSFLSVIDDALMKISLVIRGENELSNTATQLLLYRALGWEAPSFAHIPLILGPDRTLLSKKHGLHQVRDLAQQGFLAPAVIHYLLQLGSSLPEAKRIPKLEEVRERFALEKMGRSAPMFDLEELKRINVHYLRRLSDEEFLERARRYVPRYDDVLSLKGEDWLKQNLLLLREKCRTFSEIGDYLGYSLPRSETLEEEAQKVLALKDAPRLFKMLSDELLQAQTLDLETIHHLMDNVKTKLKSKSKNLFAPLQVALTGRAHVPTGPSPDLPLIVSLLGKEECMKRIEHVVATLQHPPKK